MKLSMTILVVCACLVGNTQAQTVTGSGTPGTVPVFTGTSTIGNSQIQQIDDNIGINTDFMVGRLSVFESREAGLEFQEPYAVYGNISSDMYFAAGVRGDASATTGGGVGVIGVTYGPGGDGVAGLRISDDATGGAGIVGTTTSTSGFSYGAKGTANGATGFSIGVFGEAYSPDGLAASFTNYAGGNILVGSVGPYSDVKKVFRVDGHGRVFADGGFRPYGADFAESVAVKGAPELYAPGDLLVVDASGERRLSLSQSPYSTLVAGIYSTRPGVVASQHRADEELASGEVPLAIMGIVPCKVTAKNGPIAAGDLLVSSSVAGYAMKGTDRTKMLGAVVGKALEPLRNGRGVIQVLVTLQ